MLSKAQSQPQDSSLNWASVNSKKDWSNYKSNYGDKSKREIGECPAADIEPFLECLELVTS